MNIQRLSLERLIAYWNYHTEAVELAASMNCRSQKDEMALTMIDEELKARSLVPDIHHRAD